jgi:hypothetical protein
VDSSSDEEGPEGSSLYWQLPKDHRQHYKPVLQAMRRARVRRSYILYLSEHGFHVTNQPAPKSKDDHTQKFLTPGHADESGVSRAVPGCIELPMVAASEAVFAVLQEQLPREQGGSMSPSAGLFKCPEIVQSVSWHFLSLVYSMHLFKDLRDGGAVHEEGGSGANLI